MWPSVQTCFTSRKTCCPVVQLQVPQVPNQNTDHSVAFLFQRNKRNNFLLGQSLDSTWPLKSWHPKDVSRSWRLCYKVTGWWELWSCQGKNYDNGFMVSWHCLGGIEARQWHRWRKQVTRVCTWRGQCPCSFPPLCSPATIMWAAWPSSIFLTLVLYMTIPQEQQDHWTTDWIL